MINGTIKTAVSKSGKPQHVLEDYKPQGNIANTWFQVMKTTGAPCLCGKETDSHGETSQLRQAQCVISETDKRSQPGYVHTSGPALPSLEHMAKPPPVECCRCLIKGLLHHAGPRRGSHQQTGHILCGLAAHQRLLLIYAWIISHEDTKIKGREGAKNEKWKKTGWRYTIYRFKWILIGSW